MSRRSRGTLATAVALTLALAACSGDDSGSDAVEPTTTTSIGVEKGPPPASIRIRLEPVATLDEPIAMAQRPGTDDLYVAEKGGTVRRITIVPPDEEGTNPNPTYDVHDEPVVDISDDVVDQGEQGLLGLAFSSDGRSMYLDYTRKGDGDTIVEAVELGDGTRAAAGDRTRLLHVAQPAANHNGGQLVLGPDGYLYVGLGDGGGAGDPDDTGQDPRDLLGSILRIDPDGDANPSGNPFSDDDGPTPVWLYGARNPWRFTFDRATGDLWVADVGQGDWEEIDLLPADDQGRNAGRAANLGWSDMEGGHPFNAKANPPDAVLPIYEYNHADGGCSVTGGYRYRGSAVPDLVGWYLFADYCQDTIQRLLVDDDGKVTSVGGSGLGVAQVQSFGEDAAGELYVLQADGHVSRIVGES
jgi:glucose/arabinose dehydrogenase